MQIKSLKLINFKGVRSFGMIADGKNVNISGGNATGKTTIFDAFTWLLFGKDSTNRADFQIKTLDESGAVAQSGIEHSVEGVFVVGDDELILKRVFKENWVTKRGSAEAKFSGNETVYYIDDVPSNAGAYSAKIKDLVDEGVFKLLTSPTYFNEQLHWQDRRKILMEVCGDLPDSEVIAVEEKLAALPDILGNRKLEDHCAVIKEKRKKINEERGKLPERIDENIKAIEELPEFDEHETAGRLLTLRNEKNGLEKEKVTIEEGGAVAEKNTNIAEIDLEMTDLKTEHERKDNAELSEKLEEAGKLHLKEIESTGPISSFRLQIETNTGELERLNTKAEMLRGQWQEIDTREFEFTQETVCPTCKQDMPEDELATAREEALKSFNGVKADQLTDNVNEGKANKARIEELEQLNVELEKKQLEAEKHRKGIVDKRTAFKTEIEKLKADEIPVEDIPEWKDALERKKALETEILGLKQDTRSAVAAIDLKIKSSTSTIEEVETEKARAGEKKARQTRIEELEAKEKELATELEKLDSELFLTELFIKTKVNLLEDRINAKFEHARFKLFDVQINQGIKECCETTFQGIPYSGGLNNAARISVGLDIIRALSKHYEFTAPVFIDNAEAVVELPKIDSQVIALYVKGDDEGLRHETL